MKNIKLIYLLGGSLILIIIAAILLLIFTKQSSAPKSSINPRNLYSSTQKISTNSPFSLAKLTALKNYSFAFSDNSFKITGAVYSSNNWSESQPSLSEYINGYIYTKLGPNWYRMAQGSSNYSSSPYPGAAQNFLGLLKVAGAKVVQSGSCSYANLDGTIWKIETPNSNKLVNILASACIAKSNDALLEYNLGASGSAINSSSYSFTIISVGNVPSLTAPSSYIND